MTFPGISIPTLPLTTIVPEDNEQFIEYFNRTYEDIAEAVNSKESMYYPIAISSTAKNIPNLPNFGSFIVCVSGSNSGLPCLTASLCKASATASGSVFSLGSQAGTLSPWGGATLTIASTSTNFTIKHSVSGVTGNFNIKIIGTQ